MFLSKLDALTLSKVLFHYEKLTRYDSESDELFDSVLELSDRITEYLTDEALEKPSSVEDSLEEEEEEEDDDDDDELAPSEELPPHTAVISAEVLHDLSAVAASRLPDLVSGQLEFEDFGDDELVEVFVLWDGNVLHDNNIVKAHRLGKILDLWALDGTKMSFEFKKLSKEWKSAFADGVVYMVD